MDVDSGVESVQLPCQTTVPLIQSTKVEWTDKSNRKVYVYHSGSKQPEEQDLVYRDQTKMKENFLKTGDVSLILKYPTDRHTNTYTCTIYSRRKKVLMEKQVELKVRGQSCRLK